MRGVPPGDLYVYLTIAPHRIFKRDGRDTFVNVPVSFTEATLGATIEVPSLAGEVELTLPAGTQSGTTLRLRGYGMPSVRGTHRGDHLVTVHVVVPTKVTKKQRDLLEAYAEAGGDIVEERTFFERVKDAFRPQ
jgi:molecular chaperone DnaJ